MSWTIKHFDDYHEIESKTNKTLELGCFVPKGWGYARYFGLFYKGKRPKRREVMSRLLKRVELGQVLHERTQENITMTEKEVKQEVPRW